MIYAHVPKPTPNTNADRIRAMTDEELANYFSMFERNIETDVFTSMDSKIWLDWLKQPSE